MDLIIEDEKFDLEEKGSTKITAEKLERLRIHYKIPQFLKDYDQTNLPQEALLDHCLHFNKGCYLGQEIIARLHFKGHVNKLLAKLKIDELDQELTPPLVLKADEKEVGKITSLVFDEDLKAYFGLGYVPYKKNEEGEEFLVEGSSTKARIV